MAREEYYCKLCDKKFMAYKSNKQIFCCLSHAYLYKTMKSYNKTISELKLLNVKELSWLTGFFEGEGCLIKHKTHRQYQLSIAQNELKVVNYINRLIPSGKTYKSKTGNTVMYSFVLHGIGSVYAFIKTIKDYTHTDKRKNSIISFLKDTKLKDINKYVK